MGRSVCGRVPQRGPCSGSRHMNTCGIVTWHCHLKVNSGVYQGNTENQCGWRESNDTPEFGLLFLFRMANLAGSPASVNWQKAHFQWQNIVAHFLLELHAMEKPQLSDDQKPRPKKKRAVRYPITEENIVIDLDMRKLPHDMIGSTTKKPKKGYYPVGDWKETGLPARNYKNPLAWQ